MRRIYNLIGAALALMIAACSGGDDSPFVPDVPIVSNSTYNLPVVIYAQSDAPATRGLGDPGEYDQFPLPQHAYIYVAAYSDAETLDASTFLGVTYMYEQLSTANGEEGDRDLTDTGSWTYEGRGVWRYKGNVNVPINVDTKAARAYVVLSRSEVDLSSTAPADEDAVKAVTFTLTGTDIGTDANQTLLKNLYSTPWKRTYTAEELARYNRPAPNDTYNLTDDEINAMTGTTYYGTVIFKDEKNPRLYVTCYHVAAKMDLTWEVKEEAQDDKKLEYLKVGQMLTTGYLFEPTKPYGIDGDTAPKGTGTYVLPTFTEGTQWYGRHTFNCIYNHVIDITYRLNGGTDTDYPTIDLRGTGTGYDAVSEYTPWMRGYIKIGYVNNGD